MTNEKSSILIQRLKVHAQKRASFLKHFDQLKAVAQDFVVEPDAAAMGLTMSDVEESSFRLRFAGRDFKYAMHWPFEADAGKAVIAISEVIKTTSTPVETSVLKVDFNRHGATSMRGQDGDELELKVPYDCLIVLLHGLRLATAA